MSDERMLFPKRHIYRIDNLPRITYKGRVEIIVRGCPACAEMWKGGFYIRVTHTPECPYVVRHRGGLLRAADNTRVFLCPKTKEAKGNG